jgi:hypothetical protein
MRRQWGHVRDGCFVSRANVHDRGPLRTENASIAAFDRTPIRVQLEIVRFKCVNSRRAAPD